VHWAAILVESIRVKGKQPTQRHLAYLGGITESGMAIIHQRCHFWNALHERLDRLEDRITNEDWRNIEAAIAMRVARPTRAEYSRCLEDWRGYGIESPVSPAWLQPTPADRRKASRKRRRSPKRPNPDPRNPRPV
jgi:hypothetical protein